LRRAFTLDPADRHYCWFLAPLEHSLFDLSFVKIAVLAVIALVVFGPDQLPKMAAQAGRALRDVRRMAENARADLQEHLPDELQDFDVADLNPKHFVRKHLLDEINGFGGTGSSAADGTAGLAATATAEPALLPGESAPYDDEAT
jgi:sec-independent protein translocase protein TatB